MVELVMNSVRIRSLKGCKNGCLMATKDGSSILPLHIFKKVKFFENVIDNKFKMLYNIFINVANMST